MMISVLVAEDIELVESIEEMAENIADSAEEIAEEARSKGYGSHSVSNSRTINEAYMGVYYEDLSITEAKEMGYAEFYGILITGISPGSAADEFGLKRHDILMSMDGKKLYDKKVFIRRVDAYSPGDMVKLEIFRNEEVITMDFKMGSKSRVVTTTTTTSNGGKNYYSSYNNGPFKKSKSVGHGGGSWIPVYFKADIDDINHIVSKLGFSELNDDGIFLNGLGGKGHVGKGWFLGAMGVWYSKNSKINKAVPDITDPNATVNVNRRMRFGVNYWGLTLDRRMAVSRKFITSAGFMLGWGKYKLDFEQTYGELDWTGIDTHFNSSYNNAMTLKKSYILFQPKVMMMYRILDWLSIRAEVGYMGSYSFTDGWYRITADEEDQYEIENSPNTKFDGLTFTIGPWFGF
jgi:hypothetical protein